MLLFFTEAMNGNNLFAVITRNTEAGGIVYIVLMALTLIVCMAAPYLLGSVNLSIILSKKLYGDDIRAHGSGNAGMTNALRTYGKKVAAFTFLGDFLKSVVSILIGFFLYNYKGAMLAGLFCMIGHIFPVFYGFKGGKGVVTACGLVFMTEWRAFLFLLLVFVVIVLVTKFVSLGSVSAMAFYPVVLDRLGYTKNDGIAVLISLAAMALCIYAHRENIKRIMRHEENRLTFGKKKDKEKDGAGKDNGDGE